VRRIRGFLATYHTSSFGLGFLSRAAPGGCWCRWSSSSSASARPQSNRHRHRAHRRRRSLTRCCTTCSSAAPIRASPRRPCWPCRSSTGCRFSQGAVQPQRARVPRLGPGGGLAWLFRSTYSACTSRPPGTSRGARCGRRRRRPQRSAAVLCTGFLAGVGGAYMANVAPGLFVPFMTGGSGVIGIVLAMAGARAAAVGADRRLAVRRQPRDDDGAAGGRHQRSTTWCRCCPSRW